MKNKSLIIMALLSLAPSITTLCMNDTYNKNDINRQKYQDVKEQVQSGVRYFKSRSGAAAFTEIRFDKQTQEAAQAQNQNSASHKSVQSKKKPAQTMAEFYAAIRKSAKNIR